MKTLNVTFPKISLTAKEIMGNNKLNKGKLLYSTDWYQNEDFFVKEKTRQGTIEVDLEITNKNKTYKEVELTEGDYLLNFTEYLYIIKEYPEFSEILKSDYIFTSSLVSDGDRVFVGDFGDEGLIANDWGDDTRGSILGVSSARKLALNTGTLEPLEFLNPEEAIKICKNNGLKVIRSKIIEEEL